MYVPVWATKYDPVEILYTNLMFLHLHLILALYNIKINSKSHANN